MTIVASLISFFLLTFSLRTLPLGTAYAVWTGIGAVGSFVVGVVLIVAGVIGLWLSGQR